MNLDFQDSEVHLVQGTEDGLVVRFSAAAVRGAGRDGAAGYVQNLELVLTPATWSGPLNECMGRLSQGQLQVNAVRVPVLPLPFAAEGAVQLGLGFSNGAQLSAQGATVTLRFVGEARFRESCAC